MAFNMRLTRDRRRTASQQDTDHLAEVEATFLRGLFIGAVCTFPITCYVALSTPLITGLVELARSYLR